MIVQTISNIVWSSTSLPPTHSGIKLIQHSACQPIAKALIQRRSLKYLIRIKTPVMFARLTEDRIKHVIISSGASAPICNIHQKVDVCAPDDGRQPNGRVGPVVWVVCLKRDGRLRAKHGIHSIRHCSSIKMCLGVFGRMDIFFLF